MNSYGRTPQSDDLQRRVERYAGEFLGEPSMSAPKPIPGTPGKVADTKKNPPVQAMNANAQPYAGVDDAAQMQQGWSQSYPVQQQEWSQPYPVQQAQQGWSQPYPVQQAQQGWSQPYPVQQQGWSQPYPVQQQGWSQPYPAQPQVSQQSRSQQLPPLQTGSATGGWQNTNGYTPPILQQPAPMPDQYDSGHGGGIGRHVWKLVLLVVLVIVVISGAVVGGMTISERNALMQEVTAYNDRFCEGVYVDGIHLGGMTQSEAIAVVNRNAQDRLTTWNISLTYGGQLIRRITAADLGMTINVNDALAEAWEQGHSTSDVDERKIAMDLLRENPYYGYTATPSGDTSAIDAILSELAAPVYRLPQNATVEFIPDAHSYPFEITPEVYGSYLNVEPIKSEIYDMVDNMQSGSIELVPEILAPSVTEADLRRARTLRGSATTDISTTSTTERTANIQRAFQLINGTVLKPGESFSFNGIVGARSEKNGFFKAIEYAYGQEREGYGGGVCQASTTVYLAAVRADMNITHREPHSDKVNYTEYGLDATVNIDGKKIDLTFKNTTGSDVYVMSYLMRSGGRWICHVDIYGEALPEGVTYDLVAETVEVIPAPVDPEYVEDESGTYVTYIDQQPVQKRKASDGYIVDTFKVKYINGKEVERTYVATDTYKAKSQQLWVGIKDRPAGWTN